MRLIDGDELYRKVTGYQSVIDKSVAKRLIEQAPTVEPPTKYIAKIQFDEDKMREIVDEVIVRCKDCRWGRETCGNIECSVDANLPPEYHGYEWFCPNGER